jgi:hypothetical protein
MGDSDPIQFRGQEVSEAIEVLREMRVEGINISKLGREGMKTMIQQVTTPEEKATIFSAYQREELDEAVARVFLGDDLDTMQADADEARAAVEDDTSDLVQ